MPRFGPPPANRGGDRFGGDQPPAERPDAPSLKEESLPPEYRGRRGRLREKGVLNYVVSAFPFYLATLPPAS